MLKYEARVFKMALFFFINCFYYLWIIENLNIPIEVFDIFNIVHVCTCVCFSVGLRVGSPICCANSTV